MSKGHLSELLDKLILLLAMVLFLGVGILSIRGSRRLGEISSGDRPMLAGNKVDVIRRDAKAADSGTIVLDEPRSQSRGKDWVFDLFTPPVTYYDPLSQEFAVTPPNIKIETMEDEQWVSFGVDLLEVRPRPYRLQLVGYAGEVDNYVAYFEHVPTGELLLARAGGELPQAGVRVLSIEIRKISRLSEDSMPVVESVGIARLQDLTTGAEISLTNGETKMFSDLEARVRIASSGVVHLVKEGARLELENGIYIIGELSDSPPEATVTKLSKDGARKMSKTLVPLALKTRGSGARGENRAQDTVSPFAIQSRPSAEIPRS